MAEKDDLSFYRSWESHPLRPMRMWLLAGFRAAKNGAPDWSSRHSAMLRRMTLSVCIITLNEEANLARTLRSIKDIADEIILVDSGSTDATVAIAQSFGAKVFVEPWKGFARQKNSSLEKAGSAWILSLDA